MMDIFGWLTGLANFILRLPSRQTTTAEYWIGRGVDYEGVWAAYEDGQGYIDKFWSMRTHAIRITLTRPPTDVPAFNFEAVYKTIKGYFHDLKHACLSSAEYNRAGPLFIYSVERGSGIWTFLGELRQLILFGTTLADEKVMGERLANMDKKLDILRKHFGDAAVPTDAFRAFAEARTPRQLDRAFKKLLGQGIAKVEISKAPFRGTLDEIETSFVEIKQITKETDEF